jgi:alkylation response protein AidB-like acyl-CoA dehydrogenase
MPPSPIQARAVAIADALSQRFAERAPAFDQAGQFPHQNWRDMHDSGYLRLVIPHQYGGDGASVLDMTVAQERLGRGDASTALGAAMLISVLGRAIELATWPEPVLAEICRELATEGGGINNCVTETDLGSISRGGTPATKATRTEGGWLITGRKIFVTAAPALRFLVTGVVLPPDEAAPNGYFASAIIRATSPGLSIETTWTHSLALRTAGNDDVIYDNVFVPDAWVVDRRPLGIAPKAGPGANPWALPLAAVYLGVGQAALEAACDYARTRTPPALGAPIAGQPHIQQWIGSMQISLDAARTVLRDTARAWDEQPESRPALAARIAVAKYLCTNAACTVTETALRVAGGFGLTKDLPLERYFRDARAGLFAPPQDDLALGIAGRAALAARAEDVTSQIQKAAE